MKKRRNERSRGGEKNIGELVSLFLQHHGLTRSLKEEEVKRAWQEVVGKDVASHTRIKRLRGTRLTVEVDSSARLAELKSFSGEDFRTRMNERLGKPIVSDIRYEHVGSGK